jgi:hypothetical protein
MEYEGRRCLWRVAAGALWLASVPLLAVGGFVAGAYLAGDLHHVILVALGAVVAIGAGQLATACVWPRRPWRRLVLGRLTACEQIDGSLDLNTMIRSRDFEAACRALRRARLNPASYIRILQPPADAPDLDLKLNVGRSSCWHSPDSPETYVLVRRCLRAAGIRSRVAGEDLP